MSDELIESQTSGVGTETPGNQVESTEATPAVAEERDELAEIQAKIDGADSDEARHAALAERNAVYARSRIAQKEAKAARDAEAKAIQEAAFLKGQVAGLTERRQEAAPVQAKQEAATGPQLPPEPKKSDFVKTDEDGYQVEDLDAYIGAVGKHSRECAILEFDWRHKQEQARQEQTHKEQARQSWEQQGESKFEGFNQKVQPLRDRLLGLGEMGNFISIGISDSPVSHELAVFLAANPAEISRLSALSPSRAMVELGKIESKFQKPEPKTTTDAPAPIQPVQTGDAATMSLDEIKDDNEWLRRYQAKRMKEVGRAY